MRHITSYKLFEGSLFKWKDINNFIDQHIPDIWYDINDYLNHDFNKGNVQIKVKQFDEKNYSSSRENIPTLFVNFLLSDNEGIDMDKEREKNKNGKHIMSYSGQTGGEDMPLDILKNHSCYNDLMNCHNHTLSALDNPPFEVFMMRGSRDPWSSGTRNENTIYVEIHYKLLNQFLQAADFEINRHPGLLRPSKYLDQVKDFKVDDHPVVKKLKKMQSIDNIQSKFKDIYRDLLNYGFQFKHDIDKAKELDLHECIRAGCHSPEIFFVMCMTGNYDDVDYLDDFSPRYFFYSGSSPESNLGYELLLPMFKRCLKSELLWVEGEREEKELAVLFLIMNHKLLSSHMEDGDSRERWIDILSESFNDVAENLIALNRKESFEWLVNLIKSEEADEDSIKAVKEFIEDFNTHLPRIKRDFKGRDKWHAPLTAKGKFKEVPDFEFFESKINELKDYIS